MLAQKIEGSVLMLPGVRGSVVDRKQNKTMVRSNCLKYITLQIKKQTNKQTKKLIDCIARASWWIFKHHASEGFKTSFSSIFVSVFAINIQKEG